MGRESEGGRGKGNWKEKETKQRGKEKMRRR